MEDNRVQMGLLNIIKRSTSILENYATGNNEQATKEQAEKVMETIRFLNKLEDDLLQEIPF